MVIGSNQPRPDGTSCGNQVPLPGVFAVCGTDDITVCVVDRAEVCEEISAME